MAGTVNTQTRGENSSYLGAVIDDRKVKESGYHPIYGEKLYEIGEQLLHRTRVGGISLNTYSWVFPILVIITPLIYVSCWVVTCVISCSISWEFYVTNIPVCLEKSYSQIGTVANLLGLVSLLVLCAFSVIIRFGYARIDSDSVLCELNKDESKFFLEQTDRDLNKINSLFQIIIPSVMVIFIFVFTSIIALLDSVQCSEGTEHCLSQSDKFIWVYTEMLWPLTMLSFALLMFLLTIMKKYALRTKLLMKALNESGRSTDVIEMRVRNNLFVRNEVNNEQYFRSPQKTSRVEKLRKIAVRVQNKAGF